MLVKLIITFLMSEVGRAIINELWSELTLRSSKMGQTENQ